MRITLIHNPGAGRPGNDEASLRTLLRAAGHRVRYQSSKDKDWKRALDKPAELVVVAGGDGTVARVARRMAGRGVPIAVLPAGTANNIARTLGQVERSFEDLVRGWESARHVRLDVGVAAGPWGERNFVEGVGLGAFASLLASPESEKLAKRKRSGNAVEGGLQRLKQIAQSCEPVEVNAALDGDDISGSYLMLEALNLRYIGPNLHLAADSQPGDGSFDVVMVTEDERARFVHYLEEWQGNRDRLAILPTRRGKRLQIEWTGFALHIDDKLKPGENIKPKKMAGLVEAHIGARAVQFLIPA